MEWEHLARKQKGKECESYCASNSTLKSVAEYCSKKTNVILGWMKKYVICKTHKINFTFFPATGVSAGILDLSLSVSLSERAISIRLIDYFVFASQFEYILRM